jgi:hypothetical protein
LYNRKKWTGWDDLDPRPQLAFSKLSELWKEKSILFKSHPLHSFSLHGPSPVPSRSFEKRYSRL